MFDIIIYLHIYYSSNEHYTLEFYSKFHGEKKLSFEPKNDNDERV